MPASEIPRPDYPVVNDPARPAWHFGPPAQWMNDPNGVIWHRGCCHLFYQHNPGSDEWTDMHWGHARSRDLVHWEHLPLALRPQGAAGERHCYSGCTALSAGGEARILYTSVPLDAARPATQVSATPDGSGWRAWTQHVTAPFLDLATHGGPAFGGDWRDPFVFRAEGRTFLILGATLGNEAVIPLYENPGGDLHRWTYRGTLHRAPRTGTSFFECPSLSPFGTKWLLLTSPCREVEWCSGTLDLDRAQFSVERGGRVDESDHYYATYPAADPSGRIVLFGWAQKFPPKRGWNGCLGVPRRLWLDAAGDLCSEPVAEISALRTRETVLQARPLSASPVFLPLPADAMGEGDLAFERAASAQICLELAGVRITLGSDGVRFNDRPAVPLAGQGATPRLRWLLDRSLLEVFVDDRAAFTRVVPFPSASGASLSATGGAARLVAGRVWTFRAAPAIFA